MILANREKNLEKEEEKMEKDWTDRVVVDYQDAVRKLLESKRPYHYKVSAALIGKTLVIAFAKDMMHEMILPYALLGNWPRGERVWEGGAFFGLWENDGKFKPVIEGESETIGPIPEEMKPVIGEELKKLCQTYLAEGSEEEKR